MLIINKCHERICESIVNNLRGINCCYDHYCIENINYSLIVLQSIFKLQIVLQ